VLRGAGVEPVIRHRTRVRDGARAVRTDTGSRCSTSGQHDQTYDGARVVCPGAAAIGGALNVVLAWMRAPGSRRRHGIHPHLPSGYARPAAQRVP